MVRTVWAWVFCALAPLVPLEPALAGEAPNHASQTPAEQGESRWYFGFGGGVNWIADDTDLLTNGPLIGPPPANLGLTGLDGSVDWNTGVGGFAVLGYDFKPLRLEGELSYRYNDLDNLSYTLRTVDDVGITTTRITENRDGHFAALGFMLNLALDLAFEDQPRFKPYFGGGLGYAFADLELDVAPYFAEVDDSQGGFAYQLMAGLAYDFGERDKWSFTADYRYFDIPGLDDFQTSLSGAGLDADYEAHSVFLGLRYAFAKKATAKTPAPVPLAKPEAKPLPPAPASMPEFVVYFDFDKDTLDAEALAIIDQAARFAVDGERMVVRIVGHTDTMGSHSYNVDLSNRRAISVKQALVQRGVLQSIISMAWRSFDDPAVDTGPQVRERLNRRVTISF